MFDMNLLQRGARLRRSPFFESTQRHGAKAYTVYNHMLFPICFDDLEAEYRHLLEHVTLWDVSVERQVEITGPDGSLVATAIDGQFDELQSGPQIVGLLIGSVYRLRVANIPLHEGFEVYPTIEVIDRLYPPVGQEFKFPIPIELTTEELAQYVEFNESDAGRWFAATQRKGLIEAMRAAMDTAARHMASAFPAKR